VGMPWSVNHVPPKKKKKKKKKKTMVDVSKLIGHQTLSGRDGRSLLVVDLCIGNSGTGSVVVNGGCRQL
jgi:hypothetical protein